MITILPLITKSFLCQKVHLGMEPLMLLIHMFISLLKYSSAIWMKEMSLKDLSCFLAISVTSQEPVVNCDTLGYMLELFRNQITKSHR